MPEAYTESPAEKLAAQYELPEWAKSPDQQCMFVLEEVARQMWKNGVEGKQLLQHEYLWPMAGAVQRLTRQHDRIHAALVENLEALLPEFAASCIQNGDNNRHKRLASVRAALALAGEASA